VIRNRALPAELDALLKEDAVSVRKREATAFDRLIQTPGQPIVLFGAGNLGRQVLKCLRREGVEPAAFTDNNRTLHGTLVDGLRVLSPREAVQRYARTAAFVVTIWNTEHSFAQTRRQMQALGCRTVVSSIPARWKYSADLLPFFWLDLPQKMLPETGRIREAFSLWSDEYSRREFLAQVKFRFLGEFDGLSEPDPQESYFPVDLFDLHRDELFVDCGGFDGVTVKRFLARQMGFQGRIAVYEPDPVNFEKLQKYVLSLPSGLQERLTIWPYAVGSRQRKVWFNATGTMGSTVSETGSVEVNCVTLDGHMREQNFSPTYIKMDIEGSELDALEGACDILQSRSPILAVCLYHRCSDLWRIPLFLHSQNSGYRLFLRPHEIEGWQLVCYAIPEARAKLKNQ
jgi:FkbM family methyltransferase